MICSILSERAAAFQIRTQTVDIFVDNRVQLGP
jgi:hypothetical protein